MYQLKHILKNVSHRELNDFPNHILVNELLVHKYFMETFYEKSSYNYYFLSTVNKFTFENLFDSLFNNLSIGNIFLNYNAYESRESAEMIEKFRNDFKILDTYPGTEDSYLIINLDIEDRFNFELSKYYKELYILNGGSGSGKTTTANWMVEEKGFKHVDSYTTRAKRDYAEPEYIFVDVETFHNTTTANIIKITDDWYYGVNPECFTRHNKLVYSVIDVKSANDLKDYVTKHFPDFNIKMVKFEIETEKRLEFINDRNDNDTNTQIRMERELLMKDHILNADFLIENFNESLNNFKAKIG